MPSYSPSVSLLSWIVGYKLYFILLPYKGFQLTKTSNVLFCTLLYFSHFQSKTATFNDDFYQIIWSHLVVPSIDKFTNIFNILVKFDITLQDNLTGLNITGKERVSFLLNDQTRQTSFQIWRADKSSRGGDCSELRSLQELLIETFHCPETVA